MSENCPICKATLEWKRDHPDGLDATLFSCTQCGEFLLSRTLVEDLPETIRRVNDASAKISHAIRTMQHNTKRVEIYTNTIDEILKRPLPSPREQADFLIRWLAENTDGIGEKVRLNSDTHSAVIGAKTPDGFTLILDYLFDEGLITGISPEEIGKPGIANATLTIEGWDYYDKLSKGEVSYRKAFMALKFGDNDLDKVFENVFKPCVIQAGFDLFRLDDVPIAGLIDDKLRVEIQASDFLIADLTHDNPGAYWEAGYAEGLGKPVIYTCEKGKFEKDKTHFDTNHHLTIPWDKTSPEKAGEHLKATIRTTLPQLAKQKD